MNARAIWNALTIPGVGMVEQPSESRPLTNRAAAAGATPRWGWASPPDRPFRLRIMPIVKKGMRRRDWRAEYAYNPTLRLPPVGGVAPFVISSAFQPLNIFRSSWIIPRSEMDGSNPTQWYGRPRFDGRWTRASLPLLPLPAGAKQLPSPRFPYVWGVPQYPTLPAVLPARGSN